MGHFYEQIANEFAGNIGVAGLRRNDISTGATGIAHVLGGFDVGTASTVAG